MRTLSSENRVERGKGQKCFRHEVGGQRINQNGGRAGSKIFLIDFKLTMTIIKASASPV